MHCSPVAPPLSVSRENLSVPFHAVPSHSLCMDCPAVKVMCMAAITVLHWSPAAMSALEKRYTENEDGLFVLAVGDIVSCEISSWCKVWSEPSVKRLLIAARIFVHSTFVVDDVGEEGGGRLLSCLVREKGGAQD
eukprot:1016554-Ditylum_brightwellii.AAC.1